MTRYRLNHSDFKGIIVDAKTRGEAISKLLFLLKEAKKNDKVYEWFFVNDKNTRIRIHLTFKRLGGLYPAIGNGEFEVEEVSTDILEKEKALEKEREKIEEFCAIPANEVGVSDVMDFFGEDWYSMTLRGQKRVTQRIEEVMDMDFPAASKWLQDILDRWHYRSKFIHWD